MYNFEFEIQIYDFKMCIVIDLLKGYLLFFSYFIFFKLQFGYDNYILFGKIMNFDQ